MPTDYSDTNSPFPDRQKQHYINRGKEEGRRTILLSPTPSPSLSYSPLQQVVTDKNKEILIRIPLVWVSLLENPVHEFSRIDREKLAHFASTLLKKGGSSNLDSRRLRENYGTREWPKLSKAAVESGLLRINQSYRAAGGRSNGSFCKLYSFTFNVAECNPTQYACRWQPRRLARAKRRELIESAMSMAQLYVCAAVKRLTVAPEWRNDSAVTETGRENLKRIERREFFYEADKNGRLHHNLTNMARSARKHVRLDGAPLVGVDFSTLHPNLILSLAPEGIERDKLAAWLADDFYSRLALGLERPMDRKKVKKCFNSAVNAKNEHEYRYPIFRVFAKEFPEIAQIVRDMKVDAHSNAAGVLQKLESQLIFAEVVAALEKKGIACVSLHDAIFASPENSAEVASEMTKAALRSLGVIIAAKAD